MNCSLTRRERIRRRPEFKKVQQAGVRTRGRYVTFFSLNNGLNVARLGIIATRRLGGAVRRNRAKRCVRELFRHHKGQPGIDFVALLHPGASDVSFDTFKTDFLYVLTRNAKTHL